MDRKSLVVGFLAGTMTVVVLMIVFSAGETMPRAMAQAAAAPTALQPYLMQTWSSDAAAGTSTSYGPSFGAYVLDTRSGKMWMSRDGGKVQSIGEVK
jgi:hypothetical protein